MFCNKCGTEIPDNSKFCHNCGNRIEKYLSKVSVSSQTAIDESIIADKKKSHCIVALLGFIASILGGCFCAFPAGIILCIAGIVLAAIGISIQKKKNLKSKLATAALTIGIIFLIISIIINAVVATTVSIINNASDISKTVISETAVPIDYDELMRNPDDNVGKSIVSTFTIEQAMVDSYEGQYRAFDENNNEYLLVDKRVDEDVKILEGDIVSVYGEYAGLGIVTRLLGNKAEVPIIYLYFADFDG